MPSRVVLAPPQPWDEERLLAAARALPDELPAVAVGDAVGDLLVVGVEPSERPVTEVLPAGVPRATGEVDVMVLLDVGASMGERWSAEHTRAQAAREALMAFVREAPARIATVRLLAFDKDVREAFPETPPAHVAEVPEVAPRGRARAGHALQRALAAIAAVPGERGHEILLLTDGPSETPQLLAAAQRAGRLGVPVHVVVFAPEEPEALVEVARASGGTIQRAMLPLGIEFPEESA